MRTSTFSVDAALLRELGERLIGRAHIALAELVKNAYDADATICRIVFGRDTIEIVDNGNGMSEEDFTNYWMRIGTTHKVDKRSSDRFRRPLTGSKGVGRLAAQFLADEMELETSTVKSPSTKLYALVDWSRIIRGSSLETVHVLWDIEPRDRTYSADSPHGTRIVLKKLKSAWDATALGDLGHEVWMLRSPFARQSVSEAATARSDFQIEVDAPEIEGARAAFDAVLKTLFSSWKSRIRGGLEGGRSGSKAEISIEFKPDYPEGSETARRFRSTIKLPVKERPGEPTAPMLDQVKFEILIFKTQGRQPGGIKVTELRDYLAEFGNVSVYDAGFRLPYYGSGRESAGQDWLSIALDQGRRLNASELLPSHLRIADRFMQDLPAPGRIFGAVEIDTNHERIVAERENAAPGEWLQLQSGRDRLHDNHAFTQLRDLVRLSLDFYANRHRVLSVQSAERRRAKQPSSRTIDRAVEALDKVKDAIPASTYQEVKRQFVAARDAAASHEEVLDQRAALLAPLATAGMIVVSMNHELAREIRFLDRGGRQLRRLAQSHQIPELSELAEEFLATKRRLDSIQELFAPLISDVDRDVGQRLRVSAVVQNVVSAMRVLMPRVRFDLSRIPSDLRFPAGSLAEWNALLQNIFANSWNAMLDASSAIIRVGGSANERGRARLWISDTGVGLGVPLSEAAQLFEPFERHLSISSERRSIAIGGQGLGLAIVRMIANQRKIDVAFVQPEDSFSTTVQLLWRP